MKLSVPPGSRWATWLHWGHSLTKPRAVVALLDKVLDTEHDTPYELMQDAMSRVVPDQRWGVSALADRRSPVQTKVGWVEESDGWVVNSSGRILVDDSPVFISVMTDRNATLEDGIATIEKVARLVGRSCGPRARVRWLSRRSRRLVSSSPRRNAAPGRLIHDATGEQILVGLERLHRRDGPGAVRITDDLRLEVPERLEHPLNVADREQRGDVAVDPAPAWSTGLASADFRQMQ